MVLVEVVTSELFRSREPVVAAVVLVEVVRLRGPVVEAVFTLLVAEVILAAVSTPELTGASTFINDLGLFLVETWCAVDVESISLELTRVRSTSSASRSYS